MDAVAAGNGAIVTLPHCGNYDHAAAYFCARGAKIVTVAEHNNELYAFEMPSPRSCNVWMLGVGAVYKFPKKIRVLEDLDSLQLMSAEVSIPSGQGGFDAREYIKLA